MVTENSRSSADEWLAEGGTLWPDGWYLYGDGKVAGPFAAMELFYPQVKPAPKHSYLVARKGFRSWYDYHHLSRLYLEDGRLTPVEPRAQVLKTPYATSSRPGNPLSSPSPLTKRSLRVGPKAQASVHGSGVALGWDASGTAVLASEGLGPDMSVEAEGVSQALAEADATAAWPVGEQTTPALQPAIPRRLTDPKVSFAYHHMVLRGRLRLGRMVNPWTTAFVKIPLSLGLHWRSWFEQALVESTYHLDDPCANERLERTWHALIPGLHLWAVYRLAKLILQMQVQNHYRLTSPVFAFMLALCPPLVVVYLQRALNQHWAKHVRHQVALDQQAQGRRSPQSA